MFNYMDKFNVFTVVTRCGGGGGSSGGGGYNSSASIRERQYTNTMRSVGNSNTRSYPTNGINRERLARTGRIAAKAGGVVGGIALGAGGPTFAARATGAGIAYAADKIRP